MPTIPYIAASQLAIVIPAYKKIYFEQTLASIANQTCKDFVLYIGDDSCNEHFKAVTESYKDRIRIKYKHFDDNLGQKDLVAQWERCIDLVENEEWIWLFSDDDIMDPNCVERFYAMSPTQTEFDLFHFSLYKIDTNNNIIGKFHSFPDILNAEEFLARRLTGSINSTAVEYIFRKSHFVENGRFQKFDLAWGSDDATWIKLSMNKGIRNIENANVYWRKSSFNISPNYKDLNILRRKLDAEIDFALWISHQADQKKLKISNNAINLQLKRWFLQNIRARIHFLSFKTSSAFLSKLYYTLDKTKCPKKIILKYYLLKIYAFAKEIVKNRPGRIRKTTSIPLNYHNHKRKNTNG